MQDEEELREKEYQELQNMLANIVGKDHMVVKWYITCETITADGKPAIWNWQDKDTPPWGIEGLLRYALTRQDLGMKSFILSDEFTDDDEDDEGEQ